MWSRMIPKRLVPMLVAGLFASLVLPGSATAHTDFLAPGTSGCLFEDVNDNGVFDLGTDIPVPDTLWLGGAPLVSNHPVVVPAGCDHVLAVLPSTTFSVRVTATKITFLGKLDYKPTGGRGVVFIADPSQVPAPVLGDGSLTVGDGSTPGVKISAGGFNALPATIPAIPQKSVALWAAGICTFNNAEILTSAPLQNTRVGVLCGGDATFRQVTVEGSKVNIQSLTGKIDARSFAPPPGLTLADLCDDPALNLVGGGGPPGNGNGVLDPGDFPCQLNLAGLGASPIFADSTALASFCLPSVLGGLNRFLAFNDPLIMIAGAGAGNDVDLRGLPGSETSLVGRYRVTLVAEDGDLLTQNTKIDHGEQLGITPPGGAAIWLFADPASVVRFPVDREDILGPSTGSINVTNACYRSPNPVRFGGTLVGTPAPAPCAQLSDFVAVLNGIF